MKGTSMKNLEEIKNKIDEHRATIEERFKVKSIAVFGSYLRGEQGKESDIDILVEFYQTIDLLEFIALENFLSEILGNKVDLVMKETLKPRIKDKILREAVGI
jgi:predicted nucleotidyltransferase